MKKRIVQVALEIALLCEKYNEQEILEAVKLIEEVADSSTLLEHLSTKNMKRSRTKTGGTTRPKKPLHEQRSRAVMELENTDPRKYEVLSEFDYLVRKGNVLPDLDDVRRLGERLSKDFSPRRSRRDAISKLMSLLADRPINKINEIIQESLSDTDINDDDFQRLAEFIMKGGRLPRSTR